MQVRLMLHRGGERDDAVPFLWHGEGTPEGADHVPSRDYFDEVHRQTGVSSRCREILVVSSQAAAIEIAALLDLERDASTIVVEFAEGLWCVGSTRLDGVYDDGFPVLTDLRQTGEALEFEADIEASMNVSRATDAAPAQVMFKRDWELAPVF